ncbi:hypothetical protein [Rhodococcus sp. 14-2470-1a]|uniref:hypothetical protein n=1 Tax=Rhodococcus sp. 14-2470-1a TaxID=2023150 RepID=UPI000B9A53F4|nr:hypothetical protein [Rhodococcus sp. 14-2470-1a]OZF47567.1 hypothetical protein CH292_19275 [Rhodococcus sp. 14-2470-1a]
MARYPQRWSILRENPPEYDESTGNYFPVPPTYQEWTGLLQQRFLDTKQTVMPGNRTLGELVLQLDPYLPGGLSDRDKLRFDGDRRVRGSNEGLGGLIAVGDIVHVRGRPKERRPTHGGRVDYIVAIVEHASDMTGNSSTQP